mmetsp:Transcript_7588/g.10470  ORF Transcript_7588/g.10470 Transcript_7588/m.10470 type:complete len:160 (+) Transcript_7588:123-602(+)
MAAPTTPKLYPFSNNVYVSAQVSEDAAKSIIESNHIKHVINLRPSTEEGFVDNSNFADKFHVKYSSFPISGVTAVNRDKVLEYRSLLQQTNEPTLVYCKSGLRGIVLQVLNEALAQNKTVEDVLKEEQQLSFPYPNDTMKQGFIKTLTDVVSASTGTSQ